MQPELFRVVAGLLLAIVLAILGAGYAYLTGPLLETLLTGGRRSPTTLLSSLPFGDRLVTCRPGLLPTVAVVLIALALSKGLCLLVQTQLFAGSGERIGHRLRSQIYEHLLGLPLREHRRWFHGDLMLRIVDDARRVQQSIAEAPLALVREILAAVALLLTAVWLAPRLAVFAVISLPVVGIAVAAVSRGVRRATEKGLRALSELSTQVHQGIAAIREVKSFGAEMRLQRRFDVASLDAARWARRGAVIRALSPLFNEVSAAVALGLTLVYSSSLVAAGTVSRSRLLSFFAAVLLMYKPIKNVGVALALVAAGQASIDRLTALLQRDREIAPQRLSPAVRRGDVVLRDVWFRYDEGSWVIRAASFQVVAGEIVAVVGVSGCGKSTLLDLIAGLELPQQGGIMVSGTKDAICLRAHVALVPQQPLLLDGTVAENLRLACPEATDEQMWDALERAGLASAVVRLPDRVDTQLGRKGVGMSVGQVQRLALARALLRHVPLLLLDEPTAALDAQSETKLLETIRSLRPERTIIMTSHRPSVVNAADRVLELAGGRLRGA